MHKINKIVPDDSEFLQVAANIADFPKSLWYIGELPATRRPTAAIVGSRKITPYGRDVTYQLSYELASKGVVIVSGLALGVDAVAHQAALDAGGTAIAVLPTPVTKIHPRTNLRLAEQIVANGGALLSEYDHDADIFKTNFVARNRIVSAISDAVLITEAAERSGTLSTANFALQQGKTVMAVPGNITSPMSAACNHLLKVGATPVTSADDVLFALGLASPKTKKRRAANDNPAEQGILDLIAAGVRDGEELQTQSGLDAAVFNQTLGMMEITGQVRALGGNQWGL